MRGWDVRQVRRESLPRSLCTLEQRLLVPGDHVLRVAGDPTAMVASHDQYVRSFKA